LPFVAGVDHYLPEAFGWIHARYRTPWVALAAYGGSGIVVALLGQAGTTVRGAYDVLVSMAIISNFLPFLFLFGAMIKVQKRPVGAEVRRVPGGRPVAILLAGLGLASTALTIVLSAFPASDDPNKPLAVAKVLGGTVVLVGAGVAVFLVERRKARARAVAA
jgi:amino acid transporter